MILFLITINQYTNDNNNEHTNDDNNENYHDDHHNTSTNTNSNDNDSNDDKGRQPQVRAGLHGRRHRGALRRPYYIVRCNLLLDCVTLHYKV